MDDRNSPGPGRGTKRSRLAHGHTKVGLDDVHSQRYPSSRVGSGLLKKYIFISSRIRNVSYRTHVNDIIDLVVRVQGTRAEVVGSSPGLGEKQAHRESRR